MIPFRPPRDSWWLGVFWGAVFQTAVAVTMVVGFIDEPSDYHRGLAVLYLCPDALLVLCQAVVALRHLRTANTRGRGMLTGLALSTALVLLTFLVGGAL